MGSNDTFKGLSSVSMTCSENYIFNTNAVIISVTKIILYFPLAESSTWQFHVTIFVALSSSKVKYILTFILVEISPTYVCHCITTSFLWLSFFISLLITIVELHTLSNMILRFLNIALTLQIFIHPCRTRNNGYLNFSVFRTI